MVASSPVRCARRADTHRTSSCNRRGEAWGRGENAERRALVPTRGRSWGRWANAAPRAQTQRRRTERGCVAFGPQMRMGRCCVGREHRRPERSTRAVIGRRGDTDVAAHWAAATVIFHGGCSCLCRVGWRRHIEGLDRNSSEMGEVWVRGRICGEEGVLRRTL